MDHVELPVDCDHVDITVPYLVTPEVEYDGEGLSTFPARKGLVMTNSGKLTLASLQRNPARYAVGFVQAWLYFGLLNEILYSSYHEEDWIVDGRISSGRLPAVVSARHKRILEMGVTLNAGEFSPVYGIHYVSPTDGEQNRVYGLIREALHFCDQLDEPWDVLGWCETLLAVRILIGRLSMLANITPSIVGAKLQNTPSIALLWEHMVQRRSWCPHQVQHILTRVSHEVLYYLANLGRRERLGIDHKQCQHHDRCVANNIKDDSYSATHTTVDCDCASIEAPATKMHSILREGGIPVVKYQEDSNGDPYLDYVEATPGAKYTAISHLWADGIGNPSGQSIPRCQLKRLAFRVARSNALVRKRKVSMQLRASTLYFWFDVYCVPITARDTSHLLSSEFDEQAEMQKLKAIALARMTASYSWAQYVLVLDSELANFSSRRSIKELVARVAVCNWNTRCWTYQEFALGHRVVVYFLDGPEVLFDGRLFNKSSFRWSDLWPGSSQNENQLEEIRDIVQLIHPTEEHRSTLRFSSERRTLRWKVGTPDRPEAFTSLCNTLNQKNSTKPDDIFDILANLLGLSPAELSAMTPRDRVKAMLGTIGSLPLDMLLVSSPRVHKYTLDDQSSHSEEDCWIPSNIYYSKMNEDVGMMRVTDTGMIIELSDLPSASHPAAAAFTVTKCPGRRWCARLSCNVETIGPKGTRVYVVLDRVGSCSVYHKQSCRVLLILRMSRSGGVRTGACFTPLRTEGERLHVSFYCNLTWTISEGVELAEFVKSIDEDLLLAPWSNDGGILLECGMEQTSNVKLHMANEPSDTTVWPKLRIRRDLLESRKSYSRLISAAVLFMALMAVSSLGVVEVQSQQGKTNFVVARYMVAVAPCPLAIVLPLRYFARTLLDYTSLQTHLESGARPRKLREALPSLTAELLPFRDRLIVLALYIVLLPVEPFNWIAAAMKSVLRLLRWVFVRGGRKTRTKDSVDGPSEGIEMA